MWILRGARRLVNLIYLFIMSAFFFKQDQPLQHLSSIYLGHADKLNLHFIHLGKGEVEICHVQWTQPTTGRYESPSLYALLFK